MSYFKFDSSSIYDLMCCSREPTWFRKFNIEMSVATAAKQLLRLGSAVYQIRSKMSYFTAFVKTLRPQRGDIFETVSVSNLKQEPRQTVRKHHPTETRTELSKCLATPCTKFDQSSESELACSLIVLFHLFSSVMLYMSTLSMSQGTNWGMLMN